MPLVIMEKHEVLARMNGFTTGGLSPGVARWKCNPREDARYLRLDGKTPGALLFPDIGLWFWMRSVGGRLWILTFGLGGVINETPLFQNHSSNPELIEGNSVW